MANYYFLAASLPSVALDQKPELSLEELNIYLELNLTKSDFSKIVILRRYIDLQNIRFLLLGKPIDLRGNFTEKELEEALLIRNALPVWVFDFLDQFDSVEEKIRSFSNLISKFFEEESRKQKGFLRRYLILEREWRLVITALRAKELERDIAKELQFEDYSDPLIIHILAQKDAPHYEPTPEYLDLKEIFVSSNNDPLMRYKALAAWRFKRIEELVDKPLFSIDWILAYMAQLMIVEHENELDEKQGELIFNNFRMSHGN